MPFFGRTGGQKDKIVSIENLAHNIKVLRELRSLSQSQLAKKVGVSLRTISRLEGADVADPGLLTVRSIADALSACPEMMVASRLKLITLALPESACDRLESRSKLDLERKIAALLNS